MRHLKPMATSDILDATFQLYRKHFLSFFLIALAASAITFVLNLAMYFGMRGQAMDMIARLATPGPQGVAEMGRFMMGTSVTVFAMLLVMALITIAVNMVAAAYYLDEEAPEGSELVRRTFGRFFPYVWSAICYWLFLVLIYIGVAIVGGVLTLVHPALLLLAILAGLCAMLVWGLNRILYKQVTVLEGISGLSALRRARELMNYRSGPGFFGRADTRAGIFFLVLTLVTIAVVIITQIPNYVLAFKYGNIKNIDQLSMGVFAIPPAWTVLLGLFDSAVNAALLPLPIICFVLFYYEQRIRGESFDVEMAADGLGESTVLDDDEVELPRGGDFLPPGVDGAGA